MTAGKFEHFVEVARRAEFLVEAEAIASHYGTTLRIAYGQRGVRGYDNWTKARHAIWKLARERLPKLSWPALGDLFDRDHTTIMTGCGRIKKRQDPTPFMRVRRAARWLLDALPQCSVCRVRTATRLGDQITKAPNVPARWCAECAPQTSHPVPHEAAVQELEIALMEVRTSRAASKKT